MMRILHNVSARLTMLSVAAAIAVACVVVACVGSAAAERRVALVIGNGAYRNVPRLPNPTNDAQDVAAALKRLSFETIVGLDLDRAGMDAAAIRFSRAAREADVALFYYSGHAMQFAGINYLAPIDAKLTDEADLRLLARVDDIVADLQRAKNLRILILDSCRDNPLAEQLKRSIGSTRGVSIQRGLAKIDSPEGVILAFATQAGRTAEDGTGRNSPYTTAFLKHIEAREEIGSVFRRISADVYATTRQAQLPELSLSLIGEFYLNGRAEVRVNVDPSVTVAPLSDAAQAWAATKDTTSAAVLEDFIRQFGSTPFASMARARLQELKSAAESVKERADDRIVMAPEPKRPVALVPPTTALSNAYFFKGGQFVRYDVVADKVVDGALPLDGRRWPNWPGAWNSGINAAVDIGNGNVFFFKGSQYLRYNIAAKRVDDGYPRPISGNWRGFPASWTAGFDAAINWGNGKLYFFKGSEYLRYDIARDRVDDGYPRPLSAATWPRWPAAWNSGVNAAVNWGNGKAYFFKGDQYLRYDISADTVDQGYPRPIAGNWPGLAEALSRGVDAAIAVPGL